MIPIGQQTHQSDARILNRRTLAQDHRVLASLLRPGQCVLDAGCGAGSITRGIAEAVGPTGYVLGLDRDPQLLALAEAANEDLPHLKFREADLTDFDTKLRFDVISSARVLQWVGQPERAIARMRKALEPTGCLVLLDYNHAANSWSPEPPAEFQRFYQAFLNWRAAHGWDNHMADHLPKLLEEAGFQAIEVHLQEEISLRDDPDFEARAAIWLEVAESLGPKLVAESYLSDAELKAAQQVYAAWRNTLLEVQVLSLKAVVAYVENPERLPEL